MSKKHQKPTFPLNLNLGAWDPSRKLDLAISYPGNRNNSSQRFNLADLVTKEGSVFQKPWNKYEKTTFPLYVSKRRAWDPSKKLDLAICYTGKKITALYDLISPTWWPKKLPNLLQENTKKTRVYQTSIPYLPCLVRNYHRTNGKHHLPLFSIENQDNPYSPTYIPSVLWYLSMT